MHLKAADGLDGIPQHAAGSDAEKDAEQLAQALLAEGMREVRTERYGKQSRRYDQQ